MKKLMIIGSTGYIGSALYNDLKASFKIIGLSRNNQINQNHIVFDLEKDDILPILKSEKPDYIISCTRGDFNQQLELHKKLLTYSLIEQTFIIFLSTANVFDGETTGIKFESDMPNAVSAYGQFKIDCETLLLNSNANVAVIRLPLVFSTSSPRMKEIKHALHHHQQINVYDNCYVSVVLLSDVMLFISQLLSKNLSGIYHCVSEGIISQIELYEEIMGSRMFINVIPLEVYYLAIQSENDFKIDRQLKDCVAYLKESVREEHQSE